MAKSCSQLLCKNVLHFALLFQEKLRDVIDDKHLDELVFCLNPFDLDHENFGQISVLLQVFHILDLKGILFVKDRNRAEVAPVVGVLYCQRH